MCDQLFVLVTGQVCSASYIYIYRIFISYFKRGEWSPHKGDCRGDPCWRGGGINAYDSYHSFLILAMPNRVAFAVLKCQYTKRSWQKHVSFLIPILIHPTYKYKTNITYIHLPSHPEKNINILPLHLILL